MNDKFELIAGGISIFLLVALFLSFLATRELNEYPLFSKKRKIFLLVILWCIPIVGAIIVHKAIGLGWAKGETNGGDSSVLPPDSH